MPFLAYSGPENGSPRSLGYFLGVKIVWKMSLITCKDHHRGLWPNTVNSGLVFDHFFAKNVIFWPIFPVFSRKMTFFGLFWRGIGSKGVPRPSWWANVGWELLYYQYQIMRRGKEWFPTKFVDRNSPKPLFWAILGLSARFSAQNATLSIYSGLYNH